MLRHFSCKVRDNGSHADAEYLQIFATEGLKGGLAADHRRVSARKETTEGEGFEPPSPCGLPVFKTGAIDQLGHPSGGGHSPIRYHSGARQATGEWAGAGRR